MWHCTSDAVADGNLVDPEIFECQKSYRRDHRDVWTALCGCWRSGKARGGKRNARDEVSVPVAFFLLRGSVEAYLAPSEDVMGVMEPVKAVLEK